VTLVDVPPGPPHDGGGADLDDFVVPPEREATRPPERRGVPRDGVSLLVVRPDGVDHTRFACLGAHLRAGDVVVVNTSATLPAAVDGHWRTRDVVVHLSTRHGDDVRVVELRRPDGRGPVLDAAPADEVALPDGAVVRLLAPDGPALDRGVRLWRARLDVPAARRSGWLHRHGRPITYGHVRERFPLEDYQTVFARHPGSAEMPSAGRPFTPRLVTDLVSRGVGVAPLVLHAGVSSLEAGEDPRPEPFAVPDATAWQVEQARRGGGRVVAVGTTVTRALESAVDRRGRVRPAQGWTDLVLGPDRPAVVVDGLVTGWHEPGASHLRLLEAVAGHDLVARAYASALDGPYLWHEFGDSALLLP
jgi:S-adenosylmethionine:tRNA ribosyltransferase-isomerase